jgi:hypothetical protein
VSGQQQQWQQQGDCHAIAQVTGIKHWGGQCAIQSYTHTLLVQILAGTVDMDGSITYQTPPELSHCAS